MKSSLLIVIALASLIVCVHAADAATEQELVKRYTGMLSQLRSELKAKVPQPGPEQRRPYEAATKAVEAASREVEKAMKLNDNKERRRAVNAAKAKLKAAEAVRAKEKARMLEIQKTLDVKPFLASDALDAKLVKYVVLLQATPEGLAQFAQQGTEQAALVERLLANVDLMKQILVADGAKSKREGRSYGPALYGPTMKIYADIQKASDKASKGVLQRLALAIALEHAIPVGQQNPKAATDAGISAWSSMETSRTKPSPGGERHSGTSVPTISSNRTTVGATWASLPVTSSTGRGTTSTTGRSSSSFRTSS